MPDYKRSVKKRKAGLSKKIPNTPGPKNYLRPVALLFMLGALVIGIVFSLRYFLLNFPGFKISSIVIVDTEGKALRNPEQIFHLEDDANLLGLDIKRVARDLQAGHPEFLSVTIRRQFPHKLLILVRKRDPVAVVGAQYGCLVDNEGFLLPYESQYRDLPRIIGARPQQTKLYTKTDSLEVKRALSLLRELSQAQVYPQYELTQIDLRRYSNVVFYLEDGVEVKMGARDFSRKTALLKKILTQLQLENSMPKYIDMRFEQPVVMPRGE